MTRSYGQHCGLAKALDLTGDRWTLLIVRELMIREACRYTDLKRGLPGIATNLLAERLKEMEAAGLIGREEAPPPVATTLWRLTARGQALEPVVMALGRWGAAELGHSGEDEALQPHWLVLPLRLHLRDQAPGAGAVTLELRVDGQPITAAVERGDVTVRLGPTPSPDAVATGPAKTVLGLMTGRLGLAAARAAGLDYVGDPGVLSRLVPAS